MHRNRYAVVMITAFACLVGACGGSPSGEPRDTDMQSSSTTNAGAEILPTVQRLAEIVGSDVADVYAAVDEARFQFVVGCMRADGWDFNRSMLPDTDQPLGMSSDLIGTSATAAIFMIRTLESAKGAAAPTENGTTETQPKSPPPDAAQPGAIAECYDRALAEVPNPLEPFQSWLDHEQSSLEERVRTDSTVADALAAQDRCFRESGFSFRDVGEANDYVYAKSQPILEAYGSGSLDAEAAIDRLHPIETEAREIADVLGPCLADRLAVEFEVRSRYELQWLDENADRVALAAKELLGDLGQILEFIPAN